MKNKHAIQALVLTCALACLAITPATFGMDPPWRVASTAQEVSEYMLHESAQKGDTVTVRMLLEQGVDMMTERGWRSYNVFTPLHHAALGNRAELALELIRRDTDMEARNESLNYETPLHSTVSEAGDRVGVVLVLLDHGAAVNAKNARDETPLHKAAHWNAAGTTALLLKHGAELEAHDYDGETPLYKATDYGQNSTEAMQVLLERGANPNAKTRGSWTPLHVAASKYYYPHKVQLLLQYGANPNAQTGCGETPLHLARDKVKIARLLLTADADTEARDHHGTKPLHSSRRVESWQQVKHPSDEVVRALLEAGTQMEESEAHGFCGR